MENTNLGVAVQEKRIVVKIMCAACGHKYCRVVQEEEVKKGDMKCLICDSGNIVGAIGPDICRTRNKCLKDCMGHCHAISSILDGGE